MTGLSRVSHVTRAATEAEFEGFYTAHFGDTVAMTYSLTSDIDEARDIAQEAFCRAWTRWHDVSVYDNPITWVRRVAANLAFSRWRHLRVAVAHRLRHRTDEVVGPPPNLDYVTVMAGLRKLPRDQCIALVLHHMLDLPVTEVAVSLDVPVGRVKMWLHRGRHALQSELGEDLKSGAPEIPSAGQAGQAGQAIQRGKGRQRPRKAAAKAALLLVILASLATASEIPVVAPIPHPGGGGGFSTVAISSRTLRPTAVAVSRQGDQATVSWADPSGGDASPILLGGRLNEEVDRLTRAAKGETVAVITGLNPAATYCFRVGLVYSQFGLLTSVVVCAQPRLSRMGTVERGVRPRPEGP